MDIKSLKIISNNLPSNPGVYQFFEPQDEQEESTLTGTFQGGPCTKATQPATS